MMKSMTDGLIIISKNYDFFIFLKNGIIKIIQPRTFYFFLWCHNQKLL